jgi:hypothetical protein
MLIAGPREQFTTGRRNTRKLPMCSVLRCPDLRLQWSVNLVHGLKKTHHTLIVPFLNRARNSHCSSITDLDTSKRSRQKAYTCCDAILETGPAVSMKSELLVAYEKFGQFLLLTVLCSCRIRNKFLNNFRNRTIL